MGGSEKNNKQVMPSLKSGTYREQQQPLLSPSTKVHFKLDELEIEKEIKEDNEVELDHSYIMPNAKLIKNLRRCEFRLLPALTEWSVVDVAITKYEIVLFE